MNNNNKIVLTLSRDELVLIFLGLANTSEEMEDNLAHVRQLFPDLRDKLPINYQEICPEIDHGWDTHTNLYTTIIKALRS